MYTSDPEYNEEPCWNSDFRPAPDVIAYATADSPDGPFTYQGIIDCGSTELSNQVAITQVDAFNGRSPWVFVYHDGPDWEDDETLPQRRLHAECLFSGGGMIAGVLRQPRDSRYGFDDCVGDGAFAFSALHVLDPDDPTVANLLSSWNGGADPVFVARHEVGTQERFKLHETSTGQYVIQSLANKKYVCTSSRTIALQASCTSASSSSARFTLEYLTDGSFTLYHDALDRYVSMHYDLKLFADSTADRGDTPAIFTELHLR